MNQPSRSDVVALLLFLLFMSLLFTPQVTLWLASHGLGIGAK